MLGALALLCLCSLTSPIHGLGLGWLRIPWRGRRGNRSSLNASAIREDTPLGIRNLGNTCYLNSVLQALYHTEDLRDLLLGDSIVMEKRHRVASSLRDVFRALNSSAGSSAVDASHVVQACSLNPMLQEDAQELLLTLLDKADTELAASALSAAYLGSTQVVTECIEVNHTKSKVQRFLDLSVEVEGVDSVEQALAEYFSDEALLGDEGVRAGELGRQSAVRYTSLRAAPGNLILHLKRFAYDAASSSLTKLRNTVQFSQVLNLTALGIPVALGELGAEAEGLVYDLFGVVLHDGSPTFGHYTFCGAHLSGDGDSDGARWFYLNDDAVSACSFEFVQEAGFGGGRGSGLGGRGGSCNAYLLLYRKRGRRRETGRE